MPKDSLPRVLPMIVSHPPTVRMNPTDKMMIANPMKVCGRIQTSKIFTKDINVKLSSKVTPLIRIQSLVFAASKVMVKIVLISAQDDLGNQHKYSSRMTTIARH